MKTYKTSVTRFDGGEAYLKFGSGESKYPYPLAQGVVMQPGVQYQVDIDDSKTTYKAWTIVHAEPLPDNSNYVAQEARPLPSVYTEDPPARFQGEDKKELLITSTAIMKSFIVSGSPYSVAQVVAEARALIAEVYKAPGDLV